MLKRNPDIGLDDLSSDFDPSESAERAKRARGDFLEKDYPGMEPKPRRDEGKQWFQEEHGRLHRQLSRLQTLDAYQRHKEMINLFYLYYPGANRHLLERDTSRDRTDYDVLKEHHKFVWTDEDAAESSKDWGKRLAKKYYDRLVKEYCIVDTSHYRHNKFAMRWRTEAEVKNGKGQFKCGSRKCERTEDLSSWEVNFAYMEDGQKKNTLVKVRLCPECSDKLNYGSKKRKIERKGESKWSSKKGGDSRSKSKKDRKRPKEEREGDEEKEGEQPESSAAVKTQSASEIWSGPQPIEVEKTVENEIDDFLNDIFD